MKIDGLPAADINSMENHIRLAVWYRREQRKIFEALVTVYANTISINPEVLKKIEHLIEDYMESVIPGAKDAQKKNQSNTLEQQGKALTQIYDMLKGYSANRPSVKN